MFRFFKLTWNLRFCTTIVSWVQTKWNEIFPPEEWFKIALFSDLVFHPFLCFDNTRILIIIGWQPDAYEIVGNKFLPQTCFGVNIRRSSFKQKRSPISRKTHPKNPYPLSTFFYSFFRFPNSAFHVPNSNFTCKLLERNFFHDLK